MSKIATLGLVGSGSQLVMLGLGADVTVNATGWKVVAQDAFVPGVKRQQTFSAGRKAGELYCPGSKKQEVCQ